MIQKFTATVLTFFTIITCYGQKAEIVENYIHTYRGIAITEMQRTGVPAAIKLAQGIHESMAGQSDLVQRSYNHFGIKCKSGYTGPYVLHDDDAPRERFMKYDNAEQSFIDHSDFLKNRSRYASLFDLDPTDYKNWAYGLKKAGYATNPKYPQLIISLIEKYGLNDYTLIALGKKAPSDDMQLAIANPTQAQVEIETIVAPVYPEGEFKINNTRVILAKKGTSLNQLAQQFGVSVTRLFDYNDFGMSAETAPKDLLVFLQLKRTVGENEYHEVKPGETIYDIAQAEGIRLESILKYNNLSKFTSPAIGSKLYLQDKAPATASNGHH